MNTKQRIMIFTSLVLASSFWVLTSVEYPEQNMAISLAVLGIVFAFFFLGDKEKAIAETAREIPVEQPKVVNEKSKLTPKQYREILSSNQERLNAWIKKRYVNR